MKLTSLKNSLALAAVVAGGTGVFAQSNGVPGPEDYAKFSSFITDRNIFDPNRQPHIYTSDTRRPAYHRPALANAAPAVTLVGTMSYEKGLFAFFNGNDSDLKKVLPVTGNIAGYTVMNISTKGVTLASTNQNPPLELKIGDGLRQENGKWEFAAAAELAAAASSAETTSSSSSANSTPATPASASAPNDVLKRLMELREKENQ